jgi:uncharacterized protein (TIGR03437 family)
MWRGLFLLLFLSADHAFSGNVQQMSALPAGSVVSAIQLDAHSNIYVAGSFFPSPQDPNNPVGHVFAGELSPDGSQVIWWRTLAGSNDDRALAMVLGSDDSVYVTGTTLSPDFPTTSGSLQPASASTSVQGFAARLSPAGAVVYSTYLPGAAIGGDSIAADSSGHAFITGYLSLGVDFPTSPGAVTGGPPFPGSGNTFILELNPTGSESLLTITGFGGAAIALDPHGDIYAAGDYDGSIAPNTPGVFHSISPNPECNSFLGSFPCTQVVAKISPTGAQLIYATFISGTYGAHPAAIAVDPAGDLILAGNTNSPDYPTTPLAFQPATEFIPVFTKFSAIPEPVGYVTMLNASGTALVWSTFFGGAGMPAQIGAMAIDAAGDIAFTGVGYSSDLPGLWATPVAARPTSTNPLAFVARLSPDGAVLSSTQLLPPLNYGGPIVERGDGTVLVASSNGSGSTLQDVSLSTAPTRVTAISDSADNARLSSVAPGQLITLYGDNLALAGPGGLSVSFNGIAAPLLYASATQINLQAPFEIAGQSQVTMEVSSQLVSPPVLESYILAVVDRLPSVFLSSENFTRAVFDVARCNGQSVSGLQPLALNDDGTLNSCANPASSGSAVTIFMNGIGVTVPPQTTGTLSASLTGLSPGPALLSISPSQATATVLSTSTVPGSIASLAQVRIQVSSPSGSLTIPIYLPSPLGGAESVVRGPGMLIWVRPPNAAPASSTHTPHQ